MPLTKRVVFEPNTFCSVEQLQDRLEISIANDIQAHTFARTAGTMKQLRLLAGYAFETFHNLSVLLNDVDDRATSLAVRTNQVIKYLPEVEKASRRLAAQPDLSVKSYSAKYLKNRDIPLPPILIKSTNTLAVRQQYKLAKAPPALWKIETMIKMDCFRYYTFPGLFFQAWLKSEILRQEGLKEERRQQKILRKQAREERKRLGEQALKTRFQSAGERPKSVRRAQVLDAGAASPSTGTHTGAPLKRLSALQEEVPKHSVVAFESDVTRDEISTPKTIGQMFKFMKRKSHTGGFEKDDGAQIQSEDFEEDDMPANYQSQQLQPRPPADGDKNVSQLESKSKMLLSSSDVKESIDNEQSAVQSEMQSVDMLTQHSEEVSNAAPAVSAGAIEESSRSSVLRIDVMKSQPQVTDKLKAKFQSKSTQKQQHRAAKEKARLRAAKAGTPNGAKAGRTGSVKLDDDYSVDLSATGSAEGSGEHLLVQHKPFLSAQTQPQRMAGLLSSMPPPPPHPHPNTTLASLTTHTTLTTATATEFAEGTQLDPHDEHAAEMLDDLDADEDSQSYLESKEPERRRSSIVAGNLDQFYAMLNEVDRRKDEAGGVDDLLRNIVADVFADASIVTPALTDTQGLEVGSVLDAIPEDVSLYRDDLEEEMDAIDSPHAEGESLLDALDDSVSMTTSLQSSPTVSPPPPRRQSLQAKSLLNEVDDQSLPLTATLEEDEDELPPPDESFDGSLSEPQSPPPSFSASRAPSIVSTAGSVPPPPPPPRSMPSPASSAPAPPPGPAPPAPPAQVAFSAAAKRQSLSNSQQATSTQDEKRRVSVKSAPLAPPPPPARAPVGHVSESASTVVAPAAAPPRPPMNSLLQDIRGGAQQKLKSAAVAERPERVVDLRSGLMSAIKAGAQLKSSAERPQPQPVPSKGGGVFNSFMQSDAVARILANRALIAGSDSDSSESDSDDGWSDF